MDQVPAAAVNHGRRRQRELARQKESQIARDCGKNERREDGRELFKNNGKERNECNKTDMHSQMTADSSGV